MLKGDTKFFLKPKREEEGESLNEQRCWMAKKKKKDLAGNISFSLQSMVLCCGKSWSTTTCVQSNLFQRLMMALANQGLIKWHTQHVTSRETHWSQRHWLKEAIVEEDKGMGVVTWWWMAFFELLDLIYKIYVQLILRPSLSNIKVLSQPLINLLNIPVL